MPTLQFKGRNIIWNHHLSVPYHSLESVPNLNIDSKKSGDNLLIEGDNLLALKALLPRFSGKVKCVYIDPPYNTGNDNGSNKGWVFNDRVNSPLINAWFQTVVGKDDLAKHEKWLCMMTPRIKALRELLADDGVIFISIDDNEVYHLRALLNDIFGEENFIASLVWNTGRKSLAKLIAINHEYCLVYAKIKSKQQALEYEEGDIENENTGKLWREKKRGLSDIYEVYEKLKKEFGKSFSKIQKGMEDFYQNLPDEHPAKAHEHYNCVDNRGLYFPGDISQGTGTGPKFDIPHPRTRKACKTPTGGWRFNETTLPILLKEDRIHFGDDETTIPCLKRYLHETEYSVPSSVFYKDARGARKRLKTIFEGKDVFTYPKDEEVIKKFIRYCTSGDDIVLDSFAGSGTTGQAVMSLNMEDGGNRQFILVQMTEATKDEPNKNVCKDITRERLKRVIKNNGYDAGFKYLRVGSAIDEEALLSGNLPTYEQFAKYVFYLCTGKNCEGEKGIDEKEHFVGHHGKLAIYLIYRQDFELLTRLALNLELAEKFRKANPQKRIIVYAPACFLGEEDLEELQIDFVSIPYNLLERKG